MKKKVIGLIDGQSGNIGSINKAIKDIIKGKPYQLKIIKSHFNYTSFDKIILPGKKFRNKKLIIPHMGWNTINLNKDDTIITNSFDKKDFYFVHSYIFQNIKKSDVLAFTLYGQKFPSIVKKGNIYGVQFHPEKSHKHGLNLIKNYILKS